MDIIVDAVLDSVRLLPFLLVVYAIIAYLEGHGDNKLYQKLVKTKWGGPILGALMGCVPQCGFSVIGANLYSKRMIGLGTMMAIFISTSDEAIPLLLAHPGMFKTVLGILVLKVLFAMVIGLVIDYAMGNNAKQEGFLPQQAEATLEAVSCNCGHHLAHTQGILKYAIKHSLKILAFIFCINVILGGFLELVGEQGVRSLLLTDSGMQPALAALIGLIPNCAASIVLTEMFVNGTLSLGALIAGLCTGAGVGLVMLFKVNHHQIQNLKIVGMLYLSGVIAGTLVQLIL